jgi:hypothetical protein
MTTAAVEAGAIGREGTPLRPAITRPMLTVFVIGDVLGAAACLGLIVQKAVEDTVIFAYAGGLLALGVALSGVSRALTGPAEPADPAALLD